MKELIKQLVILLASFLFTFILGKFPNFPIPRDVWLNIFLWILATFFGINGARFVVAVFKGVLDGAANVTFKL